MSITLSPGEREWKNEEQVYGGRVTSVKINRSAAPQPVKVRSPHGGSSIPKSHNYAVVIGNYHPYKNLPPENQLKFADRDAEMVVPDANRFPNWGSSRRKTCTN